MTVINDDDSWTQKADRLHGALLIARHNEQGGRVKQRVLLANIAIAAAASVRCSTKDRFKLRATLHVRAVFKRDAIECRYICCAQMRRRICLQHATRRSRSQRPRTVRQRWVGEKISKLNGIWRRRRKRARDQVSVSRHALNAWREWWTRDTTTWLDSMAGRHHRRTEANQIFDRKFGSWQ